MEIGRKESKEAGYILLVTHLLNETHKAGPKAPWFVAITL